MSELLPILAPGENTRAAGGMSFSKGNREDQCLASMVLPTVHDSEPSEPAEKGRAFHMFFAAYPKVGMEAALDLVPEQYREACASFPVKDMPTLDASKYSHEVAMAYDALEDRARVIGYDIGRNYGELADGEIVGTLDVLGLTEDGEGVVVPDYKSGRLAVPPPKKNGQLRRGALAAARRFNRRYAVVAIIHPIEGVKPWTEAATLDAFELEETAEHLRELVLQRKKLSESFRARGFAGLGNSLVRGPECRYCPSLPLCPAQTSHVRAVLGDPLAFQRDNLQLLSAEQIGQAKAAHTELKGHLEILDEQLKSCVSQRPAVMPNGRFYGPVQRPDDELDALIVHRALAPWFLELAGADRDVAKEMMELAIEASTSKAAVERALKMVAPRGSLASMLREALKRIDAAGGIKPGTKTVVCEYSELKRLPSRAGAK